MRSIVTLCAFAVALLVGAATAQGAYTPTPPLEGVPAYGASYDIGRDPAADFEVASAAAAERKVRLLVVVGGDWCMWCFMLDRHMRLDAEAKGLLYGGFEVMRVYYNDDNTNQAFLSRFPQFDGFPHFFVVEPDGKVRASVGTEVFVRDARYDTDLIRRFVEFWQPK